MALTLEGSNAVFLRVRQALGNNNSASQQIFKALKLYLTTQGKNPKLQFCLIDGAVSASDSGNTASNVLANAACRLYAVYLKKAGTTAAWLKGSDHATTASTDGTQAIAFHDANNDTVPVGMTANEICAIYTSGKKLASGLTVTQNTTATGSTLTLLANRFDGFAIVGAP